MARLKHETTVTDRETNQPITTSKTFSVRAKNSEEFYFTFLSFMQKQLKIKNLVDIQVLTKFCLIMEYDSTRVMLPAPRRKELCEELGIRSTHLSNSISRLKELGIMTGEGGMYEISPFLVWKGRTDERDKLLREQGLELKIKFGGKDCIDEEMAYNPLSGGSQKFDD